MNNQTQQALKMLDDWLDDYTPDEVRKALQEALAEVKSESSSQPVAWYGIGDMHVWKLNLEEDKDATLKVVNRPLANNENWKPLYTYLATWQSLSDEEVNKIADKCYTLQTSVSDYEFNEFEFYRAIDQALKEKNT